MVSINKLHLEMYCDAKNVDILIKCVPGCHVWIPLTRVQWGRFSYFFDVSLKKRLTKQ